jgi:hypothetical protein
MDTIKTGSIVVRSDDNARTGTVVALRDYDRDTAPGMFLINTGTEAHPFFSYGLLTGNTRQRWGMHCPTIARFQVDTVVHYVDGEPTIVGVPGKRIALTWVTRPENVVAS